jgi:hypothetical protein
MRSRAIEGRMMFDDLAKEKFRRLLEGVYGGKTVTDGAGRGQHRNETVGDGRKREHRSLGRWRGGFCEAKLVSLKWEMGPQMYAA